MISTHILDTSIGVPAAGVRVELSFRPKAGAAWKNLASGETNADGRFLFDIEKFAGDYEITFGIEAYLKRVDGGVKRASFFLDAAVPFRVEDVGRKYHVPLLLNPFGYSTYRGS